MPFEYINLGITVTVGFVHTLKARWCKWRIGRTMLPKPYKSNANLAKALPALR